MPHEIYVIRCSLHSSSHCHFNKAVQVYVFAVHQNGLVYLVFWTYASANLFIVTRGLWFESESIDIWTWQIGEMVNPIYPGGAQSACGDFNLLLLIQYPSYSRQTLWIFLDWNYKGTFWCVNYFVMCLDVSDYGNHIFTHLLAHAPNHESIP